MATPRPRRAMRPSPVARLTRIGAPTLVAALLVTGVAVAASPSAQQEVLAEPAAQTSTAADTSARDAQADRVNRSTTRDALSPGELAAKADAVEKAAKEAKATKAAAAKKAAKAKKDAAEKKAVAAETKAAAKADAEEKAAAAEEKAAAVKAAAAKKATDAKAVASVSGSRYTTVALNVRTRAASSAAVRTVLTPSAKVSVTSVKDGEWQQVVNDDQAGWVLAKYLVTKKPVAEKAAAKSSDSSSSNADSKVESKADSSNGSSSSGGLSGSACSSSSVESGLTADAIRVHRAICAKFPQVKAYGGVRADSLPEHPSGRALDAMISDSAVGWEIANWVRANRVQLGVSQILYSQKIWTVQRGSEGWRSFSDRGSVSANHYDHVHITVYGSSGTS